MICKECVAETGCHASRRSNGEVYCNCEWALSILGRWCR